MQSGLSTAATATLLAKKSRKQPVVAATKNFIEMALNIRNSTAFYLQDPQRNLLGILVGLTTVV